MNKTTVFLLCMLIVEIVACSNCRADWQGSAIAIATATVVPCLTVGDNPIGADMGQLQTGLFSGLFTFRIDSNIQYVSIQISASHLYKAGWPGPIAPIPLAVDQGVEIQPDVARPQTAGYEADTVIDGLGGATFAMVAFESNQDGRFSSDIDVAVTWDQDSPSKPEGNYAGFVKMFAIVTPQ